MRSLREFANFVGKPNAPISPRALAEYLRWPVKLGSVREMIQTIEASTSPVGFDAVVVEPNNRIVPFTATMRFSSIKTYFFAAQWRILRGGQQVAVYDRLLDNSLANGGLSAEHTFSEAGTYTVEGTIKGVGVNGYAEATKSVTVVAKPKTVPPSPPPQTKPSISVNAKGDGSFIVNGAGFLANTTVHIRVVDQALTTLWIDQSSTSEGTLNYTTGKLCQQPGKLSFSANDGRSDQNDLTGTLWSNIVETTCS